MEKYDLCIIGAGPSGYAAAMRAIDFGKKTTITIDKLGDLVSNIYLELELPLFINI